MIIFLVFKVQTDIFIEGFMITFQSKYILGFCFYDFFGYILLTTHRVNRNNAIFKLKQVRGIAVISLLFSLVFTTAADYRTDCHDYYFVQVVFYFP